MTIGRSHYEGSAPVGVSFVEAGTALPSEVADDINMTITRSR